jgi:hypothetical protein
VRRTHPLAIRHSTKRFAMIRVYMDDSGTHRDSPYCLIAGYWGGVNQWLKFERDWHGILTAYNVHEFHAKEYWARDEKQQRVGPYKGWTDQRRKHFLFELLSVIGAYKLFPFAHGVRRSEWNKQSQPERQLLCGGHSLKAPDNPMFMAFRVCILRTISYCRPGVVMHFALDSNKNTDPWALICYGELKRLLSQASDPAAKHMGDLTFADSVRALPLQAADLLAYEAYKYAIWADGDYTKNVRPSYMLALKNFRSQDDFWLFDAQRFANLREATRTIAPENLDAE